MAVSCCHDSAVCACRYDSALASILKLLSFQHQLPAALLEHAVLGRTGNPGALPAQLCQCAAGPGRGAETVDLLMCAASVGSASITQALIDCGAPYNPIVPVAIGRSLQVLRKCFARQICPTRVSLANSFRH